MPTGEDCESGFRHFEVSALSFLLHRLARGRMFRFASTLAFPVCSDVKAAYESIPYTREFFKDRTAAVAAPVDLLPPEMEEVRLNILKVSGRNRFYLLAFRKPVISASGIDSPTLAYSAGKDQCDHGRCGESLK